MRGRKPKPTHLRIVEGNRGKRRINKREPLPAPGIPEPPDTLSPAAKAEWLRCAPELARLRCLTSLDRAVFAAYCIANAGMLDAETRATKLGEWTPALTRQFTQFQVAVRSHGSELGLSPAARSRINIGDNRPANASDLPSELGDGPSNSAGA